MAVMTTTATPAPTPTATPAPASSAMSATASASVAADLSVATPTVVELCRQPLRLAPDGAVETAAGGPAVHDTGWVLARFHAETDADVHADHWERHPGGDEVVASLGGSLRAVFRGERGQPDQVVTLGPGGAAVIPRGRWHRLQVDGPTDLLVVTVRPGTELEPVRPGG
jgi:mannose-6-phosphate isomerase-like protein (cupin superfamily)